MSISRSVHHAISSAISRRVCVQYAETILSAAPLFAKDSFFWRAWLLTHLPRPGLHKTASSAPCSPQTHWSSATRLRRLQRRTQHVSDPRSRWCSFQQVYPCAGNRHTLHSTRVVLPATTEGRHMSSLFWKTIFRPPIWSTCYSDSRLYSATDSLEPLPGLLPLDTCLFENRTGLFRDAGWDSHLFCISTPLCIRHSCVLKRLSKTSASSWTLVLTVTGVFLGIPSWITLRAKPNMFIFSTLHLSGAGGCLSIPNLPKESHTLYSPYIFFFINNFTGVSCVEKRVRIVGNGYTPRPQSYPSSLRPNLCLTGPGIHGPTGLARGNTDSDVCV